MDPASIGVTAGDLAWAREFLAKRQAQPPTQPAAAQQAPQAPADFVSVLLGHVQSQTEYVRRLAEWADAVRQEQEKERAALHAELKDTRAVLEHVLDRLTAPTTDPRPTPETSENDEEEAQ